MGIFSRSTTSPQSIADMAPESVMLAGAGRAILLQLAYPPVGHGVSRHSGFVEDPLARLHGTLTYIYALTNGTDAQAEAARAWVERAHAPVYSAAAEDGSHPAYDAHDPHAQLWVAATLYDSAIIVYEAVFGPLPTESAERIYREYSVLGTALRVPEGAWPDTRADFAAYWQAMNSELRVDRTIMRVGRALLAARHAPAWVRLSMPVARILTAGLLTPELRTAYGLPYGPGHDAVFRALMRGLTLVFPRLPARIRHAPMHYYLARLDGVSPSTTADEGAP
ncbi:oxygenase MpaB family protein [Arthrobacter rhombi]|uniref:oxygenase MpaB family protein n=1 Tax=Arthrobacter rhombi TaxID=71253 RepID=UPI003FCFE396